MEKPGPPAWWYDDPSGRHDLRYWTGAAWSDFVIDGPTRTPALDPVEPSAVAEADHAHGDAADQVEPTEVQAWSPTTLQRVRALGVVLGAAGGLLVAGSFLYWVNAVYRDRDTLESVSGGYGGLRYAGAWPLGLGCALIAIAFIVLVAPMMRIWFRIALGASLGAGLFALKAVSQAHAEQSFWRTARTLTRDVPDPELDLSTLRASFSVGVGAWLIVAGAALAFVIAIIGCKLQRDQARLASGQSPRRPRVREDASSPKPVVPTATAGHAA